MNKFPTIPCAHKLAIVSSLITTEELLHQEVLIGKNQEQFRQVLGKAGLALASCFIGSLYEPDQLKLDLAQFNPNIIVTLGTTALNYAHTGTISTKLKITKWRGSLYESSHFDQPGRKCLFTQHPANVWGGYIRGQWRYGDYKQAPYFAFDLKRAVSEALNPSLVLPKRLLLTEPTYDQTIENLRALRLSKAPVSLDIEGGINTMSCISFATLPTLAFITPFVKKDGTSYWSEQEECVIWRELALTLEDINIPKCLQNSLYDTFVLQYSYGIRVRNVVDDTMLKHWSLYCELRKSLGVQTSIYTRQPYYKFMRLQNEDDEPAEKNENSN